MSPQPRVGRTKSVPPGRKCSPQGHTTFSVLPHVKLMSPPWGTRTNWTNGARPSQDRAAALFHQRRTQLRSQQGSPGPCHENVSRRSLARCSEAGRTQLRSQQGFVRPETQGSRGGSRAGSLRGFAQRDSQGPSLSFDRANCFDRARSGARLQMAMRAPTLSPLSTIHRDVDGSGSALMEEAEGSEILLNPPPPFTMMRPGVSLARDQGASS